MCTSLTLVGFQGSMSSFSVSGGVCMDFLVAEEEPDWGEDEENEDPEGEFEEGFEEDF